MPSVAQEIAMQVNSPWVTPAVVQTFLALSKPVRVAVYQYLRSQEATLSIAEGKFTSFSRTGDKLAEKLTAISGALDEILTQADKVLQAVPLDSIAKESPELSTILRQIGETIPLAIPAPLARVVADLTGQSDFFAGVSSYKELRDRFDELQFRIARATALSTYANQAVTNAQDIRQQVLAYIELLNILND